MRDASGTDKSQSRAIDWAIDCLIPLSLVVFAFTKEGGSNILVTAWVALSFWRLPHKTAIEWGIIALFLSQTHVYIYEPKYPYVSKLANYLILLTGFGVGWRSMVNPHLDWERCRRWLWLFASLGLPLLIVAILREVLPTDWMATDPPAAWILPLNRNGTAFLVSIAATAGAALVADSWQRHQTEEIIDKKISDWLALALAAANVMLLVLSGARGALLLPILGVIGTIAVIHCGPKWVGMTRRRRLSLIAASIAMPAVLALHFYGPWNQQSARNQYSDLGRLEIARCYAELPFLPQEEAINTIGKGLTGIGQSKDRARRLCKKVSRRFAPSQHIGLTTAHNILIQALSENGLIGLSLVGFGFIALIRNNILDAIANLRVLNDRRNTHATALLALPTLSFVALSMSLIGGHPVSGPMLVKLLIGVILGIGLRLSKKPLEETV